jgi:hypothetical protein
MNQLLDFLFLRRPKLDYISPPVCEVIFTGSGGPIITLEDLERLLGPTGFKLGGRGGHWLSWNNYPGIICFNLYFSPSGNPLGPFELINECVPPSTVLVCSAGYYRVVTHVDGEPDIMSGWSFADGSQYQQLDLPRVDGVTSYDVNFAPPNAPLDADGNPETFFNVFQGVPPGGNAVETCQPGCYRITILVPLGESPPSEAQCEDFIPQLCLTPLVYDRIQQRCVLPGECYETLCDVGFHFDQTICDCVANGGCSGIQFVDDLGTGSFNSTAPAFGGYVGFLHLPGTKPWVYFDRVSQSIDTASPPGLHPGGTGSTYVAGGNKHFFGNEGPDYFFLDAITPSIVAVTLFSLAPGESLAAISRMNPDGSFMYPVDSGSGQHTNAHIYRPETNDWLTVGVTSPIQVAQHLWDMNSSRVVTGDITPVIGNQRAVKIVGGTTATNVLLPADAPIPANRNSGGLQINNAGSVVGYYLDLTATGALSPFVSLSGGSAFTIINGEATGYSLYNNTGLFITENDIVAGNVLDTNTGLQRGFTWTQGGGTVFLSDPGVRSFVSGVNASGIIVGYSEVTGLTNPAVWRSGVWTTFADLGMTAAGWTDINLEISPQGNLLTDDGFVFGTGTFNGDTGHGYALKLCP